MQDYPAKLSPSNELERLLIAAQRKDITTQSFLEAFAAASIFVPSSTPVETDIRDLSPMIFDRDGLDMISIFSRLDYPEVYREDFKYCLQIDVFPFFKAVQPSNGIVLNPGYDSGMEFFPDGIAGFIKDFGDAI